jgi:hypothetical protein
MSASLARAVCTVLVVAAAVGTAGGAGSITGQGRLERIAGNPGMGYEYLYEWALFVSPSDDSMVGPSRRLGAPSGEPPRGDGYFHIQHLPAETYSVYVNQPDFFASPKVVPNIQVHDGQTTTCNVDLDVDYSTYFRDSGQWTGWGWDWYQTFTAAGTSVRGVSWVLAGWGQYGGKTARVRILEDSGQSDVRYWTEVGRATDGNIASDSDEWVRWHSGDVPLVPGNRYAVNIHIDGGMAVYKRNKDAQSYQGGRAYDQHGNPQNFDLNMTVFVDRDDMVTHTRKSPGPGQFDGSLNDTRWGQSFVATGQALAAADLFAASGQTDIELLWTVRLDGPTGRQVGPAKWTRGAYFASSTDLIGVSFNPDEVPLVPGETYYIGVETPYGLTPYMMTPGEQYADGRAYRHGAVTNQDLSMTIVEYAVPEPASLALLLAGIALVAGRMHRSQR